jgi:4-hydroxy-tetrahydrodipicolinate reductase
MSQLKVGVVGAAGKMGKELQQVIAEAGLIPYLGMYNKAKPEGFTYIANSWNDKQVGFVDLWIDFSLPDNFDQSLKNLAGLKRPIVSGTTGLSAIQKEQLKEASKHVPILWSSNMSVGIAFLNRLLAQFSAIKDFDFQIEELHHKNKIDAPSGTAKTLQENLEAAIGKSIPQTLSIRGGGIFGVHRIWAMSDQEVIIIEHQALNRKVFAEGALRAGLALMNKSPGLYSMKDLL